MLVSPIVGVCVCVRVYEDVCVCACAYVDAALQRIDWRSSDLDVERCRLKQKSKVERAQSAYFLPLFTLVVLMSVFS